MDAILQFTVSNQTLERQDDFVVVEGSENYLRARFDFTTEDWDGLIKTGVFIDEDGDIHPSLCADDICDVPKEWLIKQKGYVGVIGSDGSTKITTRAVKVNIKEKGYVSAGEIDEETQTYFDQILQALAENLLEVRNLAEAAEASSVSAEAWAHGHTDFPERGEDNAAYYARLAHEDAVRTTADRTAVVSLTEHVDDAAKNVEENLANVKDLASQAQTAAENALQGKTDAEAAQKAAEIAQAGAKEAEGQANKYAEQAAEDQKKTADLKAETEINAAATASDREATQALADNFTATYKQAVNDIKNVGQAQTERVQGAGESAVEDIAVARSDALLEVNAAGEGQTQAINAAGAGQVSAVQQEGNTQLENVREAAAGITADREQIAENTAALAGLSFSINEEKNCLQVTYNE